MPGLSVSHWRDAAFAFSGCTVSLTGVGISRYALIDEGTPKLVTGTAVTVTLTLALTLSYLACTVVVPGAWALTRPFFTVATFSSSDVHSRATSYSASAGTVEYLISSDSPCMMVIVPFSGCVMTISRNSELPPFSFLQEIGDNDISTMTSTMRYRIDLILKFANMVDQFYFGLTI